MKRQRETIPFTSSVSLVRPQVPETEFTPTFYAIKDEVERVQFLSRISCDDAFPPAEQLSEEEEEGGEGGDEPIDDQADATELLMSRLSLRYPPPELPPFLLRFDAAEQQDPESPPMGGQDPREVAVIIISDDDGVEEKQKPKRTWEEVEAVSEEAAPPPVGDVTVLPQEEGEEEHAFDDDWRAALEEDVKEEKTTAMEREIAALKRLSEASLRANAELAEAFSATFARERAVMPQVPRLTREQQAIVDDALSRKGSPDDVLVAGFDLEIKRSDICTLRPTGWLNDELINFYGGLISQRCMQRVDIPRVFWLNSFFFPLLLDHRRGYQFQRVRKWTKDVDVFDYDMVIIPVHLGNHWCLAVISILRKQIQYYDSLGSPNSACLDALRRWVADEWENKHGKRPADERPPKPDLSKWKVGEVAKIPAQKNGYDCGVFACKFAECISRGAPLSFSQADMPTIRRSMVHEIVTKRLFFDS